MPLFRRSRNDATVPSPNKAIVAAATRMTAPDYSATRVYKQGWQVEAYRQYDLSSHLRFAVEWMANSLSRVRITVAEVDEKGRILRETDDAEVLAAVEGLIGNPGYTSELLYDFGINLGIAGDSYLIGWEGDEGYLDKFLVVSVEEITDSTEGFTIDLGNGEQFEVDPNRELVYRVHKPHPRKRAEANSAVRGALPILRSMEELKKYQSATVYNRLAGAGILMLPSEITFPQSGQDLQPGESPFMATLADAMLTPISDPGDPSSVVPIVVQAPGDMIGQAQWLVSPAAELTGVTADLYDKELRNLALGLDIPTEVMLGGGDASRWHSWQVEESAIKINVEPLAIIIACALTKAVLKPALEALGRDEDRFVFWIDSTELVQRPDRSANALTMHERGLISDDVLLVETGFSPDSKPEGDEICRNLAKELVRLAPRMAEDHLPLIAELLGLEACGIDPKQLEPAPNPDGGTPRDGAQPDPAPESRPAPPSEGE